ncbi:MULTISPECIES: inositol-1-monophosphatase [Gammaproteobacteria]|uniref:inositol-1-monophosphatase n=1 Tax=Gammaproteobacteria TaxID=1236 RepID=UPI000DD0781D|nr:MULTISPECIES: inositol-1-monophosphatase [Gammaproteobacteria]RTE86219.1 inositol-1-monophosphatase [Aliidiomarina sp. B3213]TCZ91570.1 inositol-1-monophosphatase [Lysobacter sp. N42]
MHAMLNIAVRAARAAGKVLVKAYENPQLLEVDSKSENDFVTNADKAAEEAIIATIKKSYPRHSILAEESGLDQGDDADYQWVIDPLDGTTNFMRGIPHFCVSIALTVKGVPQHAVVYDPIRDDLFTASKGSGSQLNGFRTRVASKKSIEGTLLATGFPFRMKEILNDYQKVFNAYFMEAADIRRAGSAALDLAYVACGRVDGYFEAGLKPWDTMAGELLVKESGGMVTDFAGGMNQQASGNIVAANQKVIQQMLIVMRKNLPATLQK